MGIAVADDMYLLNLPRNKASAMPVPQGGDVPAVYGTFWMPGLLKRPFPAGLVAGIESLEVIDQLAGVPTSRQDSLVVVHAGIRIPERTSPDTIATPDDAWDATDEARELAGGTIIASDRRHCDHANAAAS